MTLFDLILIAISLSMDAFAVSICKGLSVHKVSFAHAMTCGLWFGGFQFLMPTLGFFLGDRFAVVLTNFGPWVAFVLLAIVTAVLTGAVYLGFEGIIWFLRLPAEIAPLMRTYLKIVFAGLAAIFLYNYFASLLRALGNSMVPLLFLALSAGLPPSPALYATCCQLRLRHRF